MADAPPYCVRIARARTFVQAHQMLRSPDSPGDKNVQEHLRFDRPDRDPRIAGERKQVHFYRDGYAWNANPDGSVIAAPQDATERMLEIVMTPHGFIKAALNAHDLRMDTHYESTNSTRKVHAVMFKYRDKYP